MKRLIVFALTLVLPFGAVGPALAHANTGPVAVPSVVLPVGAELTDEELAEIRGEAIHWGTGALIGLGGFLLTSWDQEKDADWWIRLGTSVAVGALTGGIAQAAGALTGAAALTAAEAVAVDAILGITDAVVITILGNEP